MAIVFYISCPVWATHVSRAANVQSPEEVAHHTICLTQGLWHATEGPELVRTAFRSLETLSQVHVSMTDADEAICHPPPILAALSPALLPPRRYSWWLVPSAQ